MFSEVYEKLRAREEARDGEMTLTQLRAARREAKRAQKARLAGRLIHASVPDQPSTWRGYDDYVERMKAKRRAA